MALPPHAPQGPPEAVHAMLSELHAAPSADSHMAEARVLLAMEGLHSRAFSSWAAAFVPSASALEAAEAASASQ